MSKILIVGATGTIGNAVAKELAARHTIIKAARNSGDVQVDITQADSIKVMYQEVGKVDAVICASGTVHFGKLTELTESQCQFSLRNKLMGQINLVLQGIDYLHDGGSFTLTSGILNRDPIREGVCASVVNGALDSFVKAAAIEMPRGIRINVISPTVLAECMDRYAEYFRGFQPVAASTVALAYSKSVEGLQTGQVYTVP